MGTLGQIAAGAHEAAHAAMAVALGASNVRAYLDSNRASGSATFEGVADAYDRLLICFAGPVAGARVLNQTFDLTRAELASDRQQIEAIIGQDFAGQRRVSIQALDAATDFVASNWKPIAHVGKNLTLSGSAGDAYMRRIFGTMQRPAPYRAPVAPTTMATSTCETFEHEGRVYPMPTDKAWMKHMERISK